MVQEVKVYSTPTCPWCRKTKQFLEANKITYEDIDVAGNVAARSELVSKSGQLAVPVVDIDGEMVVGFNERVLREKLGLPQ